LFARPLPEVAFLVDASAERTNPRRDWSDTLYSAFSQLAQQEIIQKSPLAQAPAQPK
jgi:phytoene synthase